MKDVGIFYGHLVHCTVFCSTLLTFGIYIFSRFGTLYQEKSGNPCYIWHRNAPALNGMFVLAADQISVRREKKVTATKELLKTIARRRRMPWNDFAKQVAWLSSVLIPPGCKVYFQDLHTYVKH
jgi:hypothetical protein